MALLTCLSNTEIIQFLELFFSHFKVSVLFGKMLHKVENNGFPANCAVLGCVRFFDFKTDQDDGSRPVPCFLTLAEIDGTHNFIQQARASVLNIILDV